jgi:hypothetical protein
VYALNISTAKLSGFLLPILPTVTVAVLVTVAPAAFLHVSVYVVVTVGFTMSEPLVAFVPAQPVGPVALQEVVLVLLHVSLVVPPEGMEVGEAVRVRVRVGAVVIVGGVVTVTIVEYPE